LNIYIKDNVKYKEPHKLSKLELIDFVKLIIKIGEAMTNIGNELILDPETVEALTYVTQYLSPVTMDTKRIEQILFVDRATYDDHGNVLILSQGNEDVVIPLHNVRERLYQYILPILNYGINWKQLEVYITSKHVNRFKMDNVTLIQLYKILSNTMFKVKRFKGLGGMKPEDKVMTCMDARYRTTHQIKSVGDVRTIYDCLGDDSSYRKQILIKK
jgi:DNA gyrase/topoisomerase IV subunit B